MHNTYKHTLYLIAAQKKQKQKPIQLKMNFGETLTFTKFLSKIYYHKIVNK